MTRDKEYLGDLSEATLTILKVAYEGYLLFGKEHFQNLTFSQVIELIVLHIIHNLNQFNEATTVEQMQRMFGNDCEIDFQNDPRFVCKALSSHKTLIFLSESGESKPALSAEELTFLGHFTIMYLLARRGTDMDQSINMATFVTTGQKTYSVQYGLDCLTLVTAAVEIHLQPGLPLTINTHMQTVLQSTSIEALMAQMRIVHDKSITNKTALNLRKLQLDAISFSEYERLIIEAENAQALKHKKVIPSGKRDNTPKAVNVSGAKVDALVRDYRAEDEAEPTVLATAEHLVIVAHRMATISGEQGLDTADENAALAASVLQSLATITYLEADADLWMNQYEALTADEKLARILLVGEQNGLASEWHCLIMA